MTPAVTHLCPRCGHPLAESALQCTSCDVQVQEEQARLAGREGRWADAKAAWTRVMAASAPGSDTHQQARERITNIDAQLTDASKAAAREGRWKRRFARLGPAGIVLWKAKTAVLLFLTKGKLLLVGLTKMSTLLSMLLSLGVYCTMYGWRFALGLVLSIYVHEMGHVAALRRFGIAATAPMFIPGFGALIRLRQYPANVAQDARTGLAGPIYGLGAAAFAWGAGLLGGGPVWFAIAKTGAWINLFNLIPVWQLDGGRGFRALTRQQRGVVLAVAAALWIATEQSMLLFIVLGAAYKLFSRDYAQEPDRSVLMQYAGLLVFLSALLVLG